MSGHSKWANIKRRKAAVDAKKGAVFTKLGKELIAAARDGGGNPDTNFRLRMAIDKARAANMPMDNIQRSIMKGTGEGDEGAVYDEFAYEGYGPGGVAIMVDLMSENRNRTAQEIRHLFSRHGGSLGESGCVAWMFKKQGSIILAKEHNRISEDDLLLVALEAGAEDLRNEEEVYEVVTSPGDLERVARALTAAGLKVAEAETAMVPQSTVSLEGETAEKCLELMDALEEHEDVQHVYANLEVK